MQRSSREMICFIAKVRPTDDLDKYLIHSFPSELDFVRGLLRVHPDSRLDAVSALQHEYLAHLHKPEEESKTERPRCAEAFAFEEERCDKR